MQYCTQFYGRRPYGVGMLVAGYDVSFIFMFDYWVMCNVPFYSLSLSHGHLLFPSLASCFLSSRCKVLICIRLVHPLIIMTASVWLLVQDHSLPGHIWKGNLTAFQMVGEREERERERERGEEKGGKESYYFFLSLLHVYLASLDELIGHGLLALRECLPSDSELTSKVILSCNADPALIIIIIIIIVLYFLL